MLTSNNNNKKSFKKKNSKKCTFFPANFSIIIISIHMATLKNLVVKKLFLGYVAQIYNKTTKMSDFLKFNNEMDENIYNGNSIR